MTTRITVVRIIGQIRSELDRILEHESSLESGLAETSALLPRVDIAQSDSGLCLLVEVPATAAQDLDVGITNNVVTVSGNKRATASPSGARFLRIERQWGQFERSLELPTAVNPKEGRAVLRHGVLRIDFPLLSEQRNRTYRLKVEAGDKIE